jgi:hypothetical protein
MNIPLIFLLIIQTSHHYSIAIHPGDHPFLIVATLYKVLEILEPTSPSSQEFPQLSVDYEGSSLK